MVSVSCFGVRVSMMFHFMFVHYTFSSVLVAEWPPFMNRLNMTEKLFTGTLNHNQNKKKTFMK